VKDHINTWQDRIKRYSEINIQAIAIDNRVIKLITPNEGIKGHVKDARILPIRLPAEIK
jgi:hypothetical protein